MISALHLLWICPLSAFIGATLLSVSITATTPDEEEALDEYEYDY